MPVVVPPPDRSHRGAEWCWRGVVRQHELLWAPRVSATDDASAMRKLQVLYPEGEALGVERLHPVTDHILELNGVPDGI